MRAPAAGGAPAGGTESSAGSVWATFSTEVPGAADLEPVPTIVNAVSILTTPDEPRTSDRPVPIAAGEVEVRLEVGSIATTSMEARSGSAAATVLPVGRFDAEPGGADNSEEVGAPGQNEGPSVAGTSLFGVPGVGHRFVYVIDRSASMGDEEKLAGARRELAASLAALTPADSFEIIVYNQEPRCLQSDGRRGLTPANSRECRKALARMQSVTAEGASGHFSALLAALRLCPDTLYLVTDGALPALTPAEVRRIHEANRCQCHICCIHLRSSSAAQLEVPAGDDGWMANLAAATGGMYVLRWPADRRAGAN